MNIEVAAASKRPDGIIDLTFLQQNFTLVKNEVQLGWQLAIKLDETKGMPILLRTGEWSLLDNEAREYAMKEMNTWPKVAVLVNDLGQKILGSSAIKLFGHPDKMKLFDSEETALEWLKT
jgi:hypothetical protein